MSCRLLGATKALRATNVTIWNGDNWFAFILCNLGVISRQERWGEAKVAKVGGGIVGSSCVATFRRGAKTEGTLQKIGQWIIMDMNICRGSHYASDVAGKTLWSGSPLPSRRSGEEMMEAREGTREKNQRKRARDKNFATPSCQGFF